MDDKTPDDKTLVRCGLAAWRTRMAYIDGNGNYHQKRRPWHHSGPIAVWNKQVKRAYPDVEAFHKAAKEGSA